MSKRSLGMQDVPVARRADDSLGLDTYAVALARFIAGCPTPISIGIQGDWGLGKTSLMQLVASYLAEEAERSGETIATHWVNTWQLSQFDLGERLPITLLQTLVSKIADGSKLKTSIFQKLGAFASLGARFVAHVANHKIDDAVGIDLKGGMQPEYDPGAMLESLKTDFQTLCQQVCSGKGERARIVFFIDDLDRLLPERAVEVMEVMKNFLDVPYTVFVLACDYQVVVKGLEAKFNVGIKDLGGRSFFDKIIQVPFRMPRQAYRMERHVADILARSGLPVHEPISDYVDLIKLSFGFNPRAIKRHCNTLQLLQLVMEQDDEQRTFAADPYMLKLLFASLCLEAEHPALYAWLAEPLSTDALRERLLQLDDQDHVHAVVGEGASGQVAAFAALFRTIVDRDRNGVLTDAEVRALQAVFNVSAIASLGEPPPDRGYGRMVDTLLRDCPAEVAAALRRLFAVATSHGCTLRRMRGERVIQLDHPRWRTCLWLEHPESSPDVVRLVLNTGPDDRMEGGRSDQSYAAALAAQGCDIDTWGGVGRAGWARGYVYLDADAKRQPDRCSKLQEIIAWYLTLDA